MTQEQQKQFIDGLTAAVVEDLKQKVDQGKIPDNWDGHELRVLIAQKFDYEITNSMRDKRNPRRKECENTILVNNI